MQLAKLSGSVLHWSWAFSLAMPCIYTKKEVIRKQLVENPISSETRIQHLKRNFPSNFSSAWLGTLLLRGLVLRVGVPGRLSSTLIYEHLKTFRWGKHGVRCVPDGAHRLFPTVTFIIMIQVFTEVCFEGKRIFQTGAKIVLIWLVVWQSVAGAHVATRWFFAWDAFGFAGTHGRQRSQKGDLDMLDGSGLYKPHCFAACLDCLELRPFRLIWGRFHSIWGGKVGR